MLNSTSVNRCFGWQLRKPEGDEGLAAHQSAGRIPSVGGNNFPGPSGGMLPSQIRDERQNKAQEQERLSQNAQERQAYLQYIQAAQQKSLHNLQAQQQSKAGREQDIRSYQLKMQELLSLQAANVNHSISRNPPDFDNESSDQRKELKTPQLSTGQFNASNINRPLQPATSRTNAQNAGNQPSVGPLQAMQAWAMERNIDLSSPNNANLFAQLLPLFQSKMLAAQKTNETSSPANQSHSSSSSKQQVFSSPVATESGSRGPLNDQPTGLHLSSSGAIPNARNSEVLNGSLMQQQNSSPAREAEKAASHQTPLRSSMPSMHFPQPSASVGQSIEGSGMKSSFLGTEARQIQYLRQVPQMGHPAQAITPGEGTTTQQPSQGSPSPMPKQHIGFTKPQLHVLKAQILAFRRLKVNHCVYS